MTSFLSAKVIKNLKKTLFWTMGILEVGIWGSEGHLGAGLGSGLEGRSEGQSGSSEGQSGTHI